MTHIEEVTVKIVEIPLAGRVSLQITKGEYSDMLPVNIQSIGDNYVILMPIEIDNKILVLKDPEAQIDFLYAAEEEKPLIWKNISNMMVNVKGKPCVVLSSKKEGIPYNRRLNFRLPMDVKGKLKNLNIVIHDISSSGISFYLPKENRLRIGQSFEIRFMANYEELKVQGEIVREIEEDRRFLYGCTIKSTVAVDNFIADEQRRRLMKNRSHR